jgi:protein PhnA
MSLEKSLEARSNNACELCQSTSSLRIYEVPPTSDRTLEDTIFICEKCEAQLTKKEGLDASHWNVLTSSMWSEHAPVQVVSWRMLQRLRNETWAADALDMLYLDDEKMAWAKATGDHEQSGEVAFHVDSNGTLLQTGDTVVLTKTLDVKGSSLSVRAGTVVKNIRLVADNIEQIEGRVDSQQIVILTKYVRKG